MSANAGRAGEGNRPAIGQGRRKKPPTSPRRFVLPQMEKRERTLRVILNTSNARLYLLILVANNKSTAAPHGGTRKWEHFFQFPGPLLAVGNFALKWVN